MLGRFLKILTQMAGDLLGSVQERQHVDEAKQLELDRLVAHGPFHEPIVPPPGREHERALRIEAGEQLSAIGLRETFHFVQSR